VRGITHKVPESIFVVSLCFAGAGALTAGRLATTPPNVSCAGSCGLSFERSGMVRSPVPACAGSRAASIGPAYPDRAGAFSRDSSARPNHR
jgi:hypothetical protein